MRTTIHSCLILLVLVIASYSQTTVFTYQGKLTDAGMTASGTYEMQFSLFDVSTGGSPVAPVITNNSVSVIAGIFTVNLSFAAGPFADGADRWIEIAVKRPADPGFTTLAPRQQITSAPFSIRTTSAGVADDANNLGSQPASFYRNADNLNAGTVPNSRLGANIVRSDVANIFQPLTDSTGITIRRATASSTGNIFSVQSFDGSQSHLWVEPAGTVRWGSALGGSLGLNGSLTVNNGAATDALVLEDRLERSSAANESYTFRNPGPGAFQLRVDNTASSTTPTYAFSGDVDTGFFSSAADTFDFATGGLNSGRVNGTGFKAIDGSLADPSFSFMNDTDTGLFNFVGDSLEFAAGGVHSARMTATGIKTINGTAAAPSFSFINDTDTGIFRSNANTLDLVTNGSTALQISAVGQARFFQSIVAGGDATFQIRRPANTTGAGTHFTIDGQNGLTGGNNAGGSVLISGGSSSGTANGGDISLNGGQATGTGQDGRVFIGSFATSEVVIGTAATNSVSIYAADITLGTGPNDVVSTSRAIAGSTANIRTETSDLSPSVYNLTVLLLAINGTVEITSLEDAVQGQCVTLIQTLTFPASVTILDAGAFKLNGNWTPNIDDTLTVCRGPSGWHETTRSGN